MALCKAMPPQSTTMDAGAERFRLLYPEGAISFGREFRNDWKIEALSSQPHPPAAAFHDRATRVLLDVLARVAPTAAEPPGPGALNHSGNRQVDLVPLSSASSLQPAAAVPSLTRSGNALAGIEVPPLEALPSPDSHKALNVIFRVTLSSRYGAQEKVTLSSERWTLQLPMKVLMTLYLEGNQIILAGRQEEGHLGSHQAVPHAGPATRASAAQAGGSSQPRAAQGSSAARREAAAGHVRPKRCGQAHGAGSKGQGLCLQSHALLESRFVSISLPLLLQACVRTDTELYQLEDQETSKWE